ncbi:flagellar hook-associated protein FlgK [Dechloromonas denitrificans]|uniref:flagellar hook-associated protein FlgK n=1 Tax=Dechloromonas denitrificans TaxID=281362 RepID=UPI001CF87349|nr:flagellar hook-associated protein FlgK [Dechloromonas denitrificans]UCV10937.1 flagellar hook-associated protein FlgK [Dechloromonas denitrificans]
MAGIFGIGVSGVQAAQMGMLVTQHNITNSNTPGYNRQSIIQATSLPVGFSSGFIGNGTQVSTVSRQYNSFLTDQVRQSSTEYSSLEAYFNQVQVVDDLLADANAGVSPALQDFFKGLQQVSAAPSSLPARQSMVSAAQALVSRFQGANQRISDLFGQVNQQITDSVALINTYGKQIAALNQQITIAQSAVNQPANDLLDQRDNLISELNKLVKVETISLGQGGLEVMIGKGQVLVMGTHTNELSAVRSSADPTRTTIAIDLGNGKQELPENIIEGGQLGGLLAFRSETLDTAVNSLGKVAASLALTFNAQHATGMDLLGNSVGVGGANDSGFIANFFTIPNPKVIPSNPAGPQVSATFTPPKMTSGTDGNYFTDITNNDYRLEYNGANFTLTRLQDGVNWSDTTLAGLNTQINDRTDPRGAQGITLADNGAAYSDGDSFLIEPTREMAKNIKVDERIANDVRLIAAALPVRASVSLTNQGTMKVSVNRVTQDLTATAPGPAYPVKIGISADGASLTLGDAGGPYGVTNPGPFQVTAYPSGGGAPTTYTLEYPASATPPPTASGMTYEIWDGNSRVQFSISGTARPGDTFSLDMNDSSTGGKIGVSDSGNMLLLGKLQTQNTSDGAATSYQGGYAQMVSDIGNKAREIEVTKDAQKALVDQADAARSAESGVNLDEEAANLLKFQQLYQASARSISVGQKLFDELLSIARN